LHDRSGKGALRDHIDADPSVLAVEHQDVKLLAGSTVSRRRRMAPTGRRQAPRTFSW
jgi:hypothetical protein